MPGVIGHLKNPSTPDAVALARAAEGAGASWLGLADAFWWRDVWVLLASAATATRHLVLGPTMTNPYLRHPFLTVAALATLQDMAGHRIFLGLAAGGSEARDAAKVDRRDAPARTIALIQLVRSVAAGGALDDDSGRRLEIPLAPLPVLVAGGQDGMLRAAASHADQVLIWATARSDLRRVLAVIRAAASGRTDGGPEVVWAPLAVLPGDPDAEVADVAVYAVLNAGPATRDLWGLAQDELDTIRRAVVAGDWVRAMDLVPDVVLDDLLLTGAEADPSTVADQARAAGVGSIAVPAFSIDAVEARVAWGAAVEAALGAVPVTGATVTSDDPRP